MSDDQQALQLHDPRPDQVSTQGDAPSLQGVQGQARQVRPQGLEEGNLVSVHNASTPAPPEVVALINGVLDGEVWDYETAFYPCTIG